MPGSTVRRTPCIPLVYGAREGMRGAECNGGYQPAGWKTRDGRLWFPTLDGIVRIDPEKLVRKASEAPVLLEEVLADGMPAMAKGDVVRLPAERTRLELHYTQPVFGFPEEVRFAYRLEGFDREWVDAASRRVAFYTILPPGNFRFRVRASSGGGPWVESKGVLTIVQSPRFWQTWPFILALSRRPGGPPLRHLQVAAPGHAEALRGRHRGAQSHLARNPRFAHSKLHRNRPQPRSGGEDMGGGGRLGPGARRHGQSRGPRRARRGPPVRPGTSGPASRIGGPRRGAGEDGPGGHGRGIGARCLPSPGPPGGPFRQRSKTTSSESPRKPWPTPRATRERRTSG